MLNPDVHLDTEGSVNFPGGFMHPLAFREMFGEEMWQELLARPRVPSPYACCLRGEWHDDMPNNPGADLD